MYYFFVFAVHGTKIRKKDNLIWFFATISTKESGWIIFLARGNPVRKLGWPCQHSAPVFQGTAYGRAPPRRRYAAATSTLVKAVGSFFVFASSPDCVPYPLISYRVPPISPPPCCVPMADPAPPLCR